MKGYHIYYLFDTEENQYEYLDFLCQLCSILFWKKNFGTIELICNKDFLEKVERWGLDKYYDEINTKLFENLPYKEKLETFWSFPKIYAINQISNTESSFCVLDTDLWIYDEIEFNKEHQVVGYHKEEISDSDKNPYLNPEKYLNINYDWDVKPLNCAFLYFNSVELIKEWYSKSLEVVSTYNSEKSDNSADTVFIEQRLLPTICKHLGMKHSTLIENTYLPGAEKDGSEWVPSIGFTNDNLERFNNIKHVWGLKKMYSDEVIKNMVMSVCKLSLDHYFNGWEMYNLELSDYLNRNINTEFIESLKIEN